jgi:hypothetical protein
LDQLGSSTLWLAIEPRRIRSPCRSLTARQPVDHPVLRRLSGSFLFFFSFQLLYSLAQARNMVPLPIVPTREGVHLPAERFCLMQPNYRIKSTANKNAGESKHNL